jgi:DNA-binding beta-propeller fold protein YncE
MFKLTSWKSAVGAAIGVWVCCAQQLFAGGGAVTITSADGLRTAEIDEFGQIAALYPPDQPGVNNLAPEGAEVRTTETPGRRLTMWPHRPGAFVPAALLALLSVQGADGAPDQPPSVSVDRIGSRDGATIFTLDRRALAEAADRGEALRIRQVPLSADLAVDLIVERFYVTGSHTRFVLGSNNAGDWKGFDPASVTLLRGRAAGHPASHAFLALSEYGSAGLIDLGPGRPHYRITSRSSRTVELGSGQLAVFEAADGIGPLLGVPMCAARPVGKPRRAPAADGASSPSMRHLELAIETDYELYSLFQDADATAAYVVQLYGAVSDIYMRDVNTWIELSFVRIWDTPDDLFNEEDPAGPFVDYWEQNMGHVHRDVAQFFTGRRDLPYGGVASGLVCGSYSYSVAGYALGAFPSLDAPSMGHWDVIVTAHELGHNCNAPHTHWVGIDECPSGVLQRGTIMSYCHSNPGGIANMDLRFHTHIQSHMEAWFTDETCLAEDCNVNGIDDAIDIQQGTSLDANGNGIPDECEDCNGNGTLDPEDILSGTSMDLNGNGIPDECEPDCNENNVPDDRDLLLGTSQDLYGNGIPDECEPDCNDNGVPDYNEIQVNMSLDLNRNAILDACEDCDNNGVTDLEELAGAHNLWVANRGASQDNVASQYHAGTGVLVVTGDAGHLASPHDLLIRSDGHLLVSSASDDRIAEFDEQGSYVSDLVPAGTGGLDWPTGMTFTAGGSLLVASRLANNVLEYDAITGAFLGEFVAAGAGGLRHPMAVTFGPNGNLFVAAWANQVLEYDGASGAFVGLFVSAAGNGGLIGPTSLEFKPDGDLLVASCGTDELLEYDGQTGTFLGRWNDGGAPGPWDLRVGPNGNVYVTITGGRPVLMYHGETGDLMLSFYVHAAAGPLSFPTGLDFVHGDDVDCNLNLIPDTCDIASGTSQDINGNGIPDECEPPIGDLDGDGSVSVTDFLAMLARWGPCPDPPDPCPADLDGDGTVDYDDFVILLANWG